MKRECQERRGSVGSDGVSVEGSEGALKECNNSNEGET